MKYQMWLQKLRMASVLSVTILVGCFGIPRNLSLDADFAFPDPDGYGTVFFSASNPTNNGTWLNLYISHDNKEIDGDRMHQIHPVEIAKRRSADYFGSPYLLPRKDTEIDFINAIKLPVGKYRIWNWRIRELNRSGAPVRISEMYVFTVTRDRATYLGNFEFNLDEATGHNAVKITDQSIRDGRRFTLAYPRIKEADILVDIAKRAPLIVN